MSRQFKDGNRRNRATSGARIALNNRSLDLLAELPVKRLLVAIKGRWVCGKDCGSQSDEQDERHGESHTASMPARRSGSVDMSTAKLYR